MARARRTAWRAGTVDLVEQRVPERLDQSGRGAVVVVGIFIMQRVMHGYYDPALALLTVLFVSVLVVGIVKWRRTTDHP